MIYEEGQRLHLGPVSGLTHIHTWNLLLSAGSVSMCCLYSSSVVAPMTCSWERASAGLSMLAKSRPPSTLPAPTAGAGQGRSKD